MVAGAMGVFVAKSVRMVRGRWLVSAVALLASVVACSSGKSSASGDGGADGADIVSCDDPRTQSYAANMRLPGQSGVFQFVLVSSDPAPPADDSNTWVLQILDSSGNPVDGITGTAVATMPLMGHGTSQVTWTPSGNGSYTLTPLYFFMAGLWEVAITAQSGSQKDTVSFYFCVAG